MGWEYFNSLPGDRARPWEWAAFMTRTVRGVLPAANLISSTVAPPLPLDRPNPFLVLDQSLKSEGEAPLPTEFEYYTDGSVEE